jgi:hypothetical protein
MVACAVNLDSDYGYNTMGSEWRKKSTPSES